MDGESLYSNVYFINSINPNLTNEMSMECQLQRLNALIVVYVPIVFH